LGLRIAYLGCLEKQRGSGYVVTEGICLKKEGMIKSVRLAVPGTPNTGILTYLI
jgi:hypothetical protein